MTNPETGFIAPKRPQTRAGEGQNAASGGDNIVDLDILLDSGGVGFSRT